MGASWEQRKEGGRLCPEADLGALLKALSELALSAMFVQPEDGVKDPESWDGRSDSQADLRRSYKGALSGKLSQVL